MERKELEIIQQLMEELEEKMQYGKEDFEERLGRKKPEVEILKVEGELDQDPSDDEEMEEESLDSEMLPESPEDKLKKRLLKLRG